MGETQQSHEVKKVNKLVYILLALFLGGFGVHKFIEGKVLQGILYFLFCWTTIPFFLTIFDIVKVAQLPSDANGDVTLVKK